MPKRNIEINHTLPNALADHEAGKFDGFAWHSLDEVPEDAQYPLVLVFEPDGDVVLYKRDTPQDEWEEVDRM